MASGNIEQDIIAINTLSSLLAVKYTYDPQQQSQLMVNPNPMIQDDVLIDTISDVKNMTVSHTIMTDLLSSLHGGDISDRMKIAISALITDDDAAWAALCDYLQEQFSNQQGES